MTKKNRLSKTPVDFDVGIGDIIPSPPSRGSSQDKTQKGQTGHLLEFKTNLTQKISEAIKGKTQFPTINEVFIFIMQYFASKKEYDCRDIDNMAKTVLDILKGRFYDDDCKVKTLLVGKKIDDKIPQNFAYIAIKELKDGKDIEALKTSGIERSVFLFYELKKQGVL